MKKISRAAALAVLTAAVLCVCSCGAETSDKRISGAAAVPPPFTVSAVTEKAETVASSAALTTTAAATEPEETSAEPVREEKKLLNKLGTAGELEGTTVIVSIFASDALTDWDIDDPDDAALQSENLTALKTAADWLTEQCAVYGTSAKFICDWEENEDLYARVRFTDKLVRFDSLLYNVQREYILNEIDSIGLKTKYDADNIIYIFFFNTSYSNQINPWSLTYQIDPMFDIEIINSYVRFKSFDGPPATYAHEILHCFGAYDLYYANDAIPQEYVDHCAQSGSQDIMFTVNSGSDITVVLSELDAYYVGLTDHCDLVGKWGLAESEHFNGVSDIP